MAVPMDQSMMDHPILQPWWRKRKWTYAAGALAALGFLAIMWSTLIGNAERSVRMSVTAVTVATVQKGVYRDFIPLRGKVVPRDTIYLDALEGGRVEQVFVEPGDWVSAGQPLVALSNTELELDVLDREARLIESITQLQTYQTQLEQNRLINEKALASIDYEIVRLGRAVQRRKQLAGQRIESQEAQDVVQDELDYMQRLKPLQAQSNEQQNQLRVQQLPQIKSQLDKLQKDVEITRGKLDNLTVRAPVAGRMTAIDLKIGESRARGERFGELTPDTGSKLSANIDEFYLGRLRKGQTAKVEIGGHEWPLRVTRVYPQVKEGRFAVDLAFDGAPPEGLLPGQAVQGTVALGEDTPAVTLAAGSFLEHTGGDWIFVVDPDSKSAHRRSIKVGRRNAEQVEILSGLQPGERVIVSNYSALERIERIDLSQ